MSQVQFDLATKPIVDENKKPTIPFVLFLNSVAIGDTGNRWTPVATNLTTVGTPTITGNYYQNQGFTDFWIRIVPGTNTSSTAGSTYFDLPFEVSVDAGCSVTTGVATDTSGGVSASVNRVFPPTWSAVTGPLTILGRVVSQ